MSGRGRKGDTEEYQGWKNRQTWNVALYINNEYNLYKAAVEFMRRYKGPAPYAAFIKSAGLERERTADGIAWISDRLGYAELNAMMREMV